MWFNLICILIAALVAIFSFFAGAKVYYYGLSAGLKVSGENKSIEIPKIAVKRNKKPKESNETKRLNTILSNIERYDGSSIGQEEIE